VTSTAATRLHATEAPGFVEIVSGAREGMFVNTSGNARHGQAFVRSVKDGVEQHF
jgi:hypothetical protein